MRNIFSQNSTLENIRLSFVRYEIVDHELDGSSLDILVLPLLTLPPKFRAYKEIEVLKYLPFSGINALTDTSLVL